MILVFNHFWDVFPFICYLLHLTVEYELCFYFKLLEPVSVLFQSECFSWKLKQQKDCNKIKKKKTDIDDDNKSLLSSSSS